MALKMFYRGPSSRLETLIEKIQQNKECGQDIYSSHTSSSFSPSPSDGGAATPNSLENNRLNDNASSVSTITAEDNGRSVLKKGRIEPTGKGGTGHTKSTDNGKNGVHHANGEGTYHCQFCEKSFPRLGYLKKHEQSHAEHMPFKCDYCARLFKHKRSRDRHTKLHTGDRRYRCPHCEAAFSRSDHLKIHMKTHDNQKPFQCTICNRGYNTAAALTSHMQNHKKQAALLGAPNINYSPRSTGSGSSAASLKRKYSPAVQSASEQQQSHTNLEYLNAKRSASANALLYCIYCTKNDFQTMEQLHAHIHAMHAAALRDATPPSGLLQLSCEFCTMKFPSVQTMFHHIKVTHIDRVNSPNAYIEHFNRLSNYGKLQSNFHAINEEMYSRRSTPDRNAIPIDTIKTEQSSRNSGNHSNTNSETKSPNIIPADAIKQELEQDIPTDLSKKTPTTDDDVKSNPEEPRKTPSRSGSVIQQSQQQASFLCNQCNAALPDFESFRNHLKNHLSQSVSTSFVCHHCGITLPNQNDHERHVFSHFLITATEFTCNFNCNKATFTKSEDLQKHLFEAHAQTMFKCAICSDLFDTKVAIQVHFAVAHANEVKVYRCSACMEAFKTDGDFKHHVKTRHAVANGAVQCIFCRTVCASELEMHFHLAAHARQYRCPACPESFHVEFLLDRHMQTHHASQAQQHQSDVAAYHYKATTVAPTNNNNNILDYHHAAAAAAAVNKSMPYGFNGKFYNPLQMEAVAKGQSHLYGFYDAINKSRFEGRPDGGGIAPKNILDMYNSELASKLYANSGTDVDRELYQQQPAAASAKPSNYFGGSRTTQGTKTQDPIKVSSVYGSNLTVAQQPQDAEKFGCGICEKNDFSSEAEVHTHRKVAHNLKTGVSLRCAYCNGNFRSRHELENHMKITHNTSGKHKCLICDEIFPSPAVLAEHKLTHSKVGPSSKCSRCPTALPTADAFRAHMVEHGPIDIPVQCICCRQTLNSDFEIGLHAKFHTKSTATQESTCALCLDVLPPNNSDAKVCEKCFQKHNFSTRFQNFPKPSEHNDHLQQMHRHKQQQQQSQQDVEHRCNICKTFIVSAVKLQEHLIEHSFKGCEDRGYSCYICSTVFTVPSGLQLHMDEVHGSGSKPYDCNLCTAKFFFRAELENHLLDHEQGRVKVKRRDVIEDVMQVPKPHQNNNNNNQYSNNNTDKPIKSEELELETTPRLADVCLEIVPKAEHDDEEEYIEVEKVMEVPLKAKAPASSELGKSSADQADDVDDSDEQNND